MSSSQYQPEVGDRVRCQSASGVRSRGVVVSVSGRVVRVQSYSVGVRATCRGASGVYFVEYDVSEVQPR